MKIPFIRIGNISLYRFFILFDILVGTIYLITRKEYTWKQKIVVILTTIFSGLLGARILYILVHIQNITFREMISLQFANFKGFGALIATFINILVLCKLYKIPKEKAIEPLLQFFFVGRCFS